MEQRIHNIRRKFEAMRDGADHALPRQKNITPPAEAINQPPAYAYHSGRYLEEDHTGVSFYDLLRDGADTPS